MNGVEILASAEVVTEWTVNWSVFWIMFGIVFGIFLIAGILAVSVDGHEWPTLLYLSLAGIFLGFVIGMGVGGVCGTPTTYETQYKVTISDEVSMTEFYEHYEMIEQDGKIFTVKEKTNENN